MERAIQDVGLAAGSCGNADTGASCCAATPVATCSAAFYQAEGITVTTTPYGVPFDLRPEQLRPVGMAMLAAHPGRAPRARPARHALLALLARVPPCQLAPPRLAPWFSSRHMPNLFRRRIGDLPNLAR